MTIDAREITPQELFIRLKEILAAHPGMNVSIEVLLNTHDATKRAVAFASMSGCQTAIKEEEGHYVLYITGIPCCA